MSLKSLLLPVAATLLFFSGLQYDVQAQPAEFLFGVGAESLHSHASLFGADSERENCLQDCRERYSSWGGTDNARGRLYALCSQRCERQFWGKFDRKTKNSEPDEE
ncbi:MAG: hypothetical protein WBG50_05325 [Desulfomonilaceae bacterium]